MQSYNAAGLEAADDLIERATRLSHYAERLVSADAALKWEVPVDQPYTPAEMRAALAVDCAGDEAALKRGLRLLRKRVMLNLMARDLGGRASFGEVVTTTTALAEVAIA